MKRRGVKLRGRRLRGGRLRRVHLRRVHLRRVAHLMLALVRDADVVCVRPAPRARPPVGCFLVVARLPIRVARARRPGGVGVLRNRRRRRHRGWRGRGVRCRLDRRSRRWRGRCIGCRLRAGPRRGCRRVSSRNERGAGLRAGRRTTGRTGRSTDGGRSGGRPGNAPGGRRFDRWARVHRTRTGGRRCGRSAGRRRRRRGWQCSTRRDWRRGHGSARGCGRGRGRRTARRGRRRRQRRRIGPDRRRRRRLAKRSDGQGNRRQKEIQDPEGDDEAGALSDRHERSGLLIRPGHAAVEEGSRAGLDRTTAVTTSGTDTRTDSSLRTDLIGHQVARRAAGRSGQGHRRSGSRTESVDSRRTLSRIGTHARPASSQPAALRDDHRRGRA